MTDINKVAREIKSITDRSYEDTIILEARREEDYAITISKCPHCNRIAHYISGHPVMTNAAFKCDCENWIVVYFLRPEIGNQHPSLKVHEK